MMELVELSFRSRPLVCCSSWYTPNARSTQVSAHTTAYEASGSSGTARQEGVAVSLVYIGKIECAPPPAAVQRSTPPQLLQNI